MRSPIDDFKDDGGTPMWRRRQAQVIDVRPRGTRSWLRRISLLKATLWVVFLGFFLPFIILFGGVIVMYLHDKATGRWP